MYEEQFLNVLETVNVKFGNLDSRVIKAWFDTNCEDLLKWICVSITEDCYISEQQDLEYSQIDLQLIHKKINTLESDYEDILDTESNLFKIELAKDTIEMLEEELKGCDHEIQMNEQLCRSLSKELSTVKALETQIEVEEELNQENCLKLCEELDAINMRTYDQCVKYGCYLQNYQFSIFPEFINNKDVTEIEIQFSNITASLNSAMKIEIASIKDVGDKLSELENRIFNSKIGQLSLQMEVEALNCVLSFFNNLDIHSFSSFINSEFITSSLDMMKTEQCEMLKSLEEISLKFAEQYVTKYTLVYLNKEHDFLCTKLTYLNVFKDNLIKIVIHLILMQTLYLQEKKDINNSGQFFKNVSKYSNMELKQSNLRKDVMLTLISDYEKYSTKPIEDNFSIIGAFGKIFTNVGNTSNKEIVENVILLRRDVFNLKKQFKHFVVFNSDLEKLRRNNNILRNFLISGPTVEIVVVPTLLQTTLFQINQNLERQKSAVSVLLQKAQKFKDMHKKDKWLSHQNLLWIYFMTNGSKMLEFLERLKNEENYELEKN